MPPFFLAILGMLAGVSSLGAGASRDGAVPETVTTPPTEPEVPTPPEEPQDPATPEVPTPPEEPQDPATPEVPVSTVESADVIGGRVTTFAPELDAVTDIQILSGVEYGKLTVNPDNSLALVMTASTFSGTQSFTYEATYADGSTSTHQVDLNVLESPQDGGWGTGDFYMLRTDANDDVLVEYGDVHRDVFITGSDDALSLEDIAALEGISVDDMGDQWWQWLAERPEYGGSEDMALTTEVGMQLWSEITVGQETSNWLQFERGYEYDLQEANPNAVLIPQNASGESELHPLHVTAYGEGSDPLLNVETNMITQNANMVFSNVDINGRFRVPDEENLLIDNVSFLGAVEIEYSDAVTFRNSDIIDVAREQPTTDDDIWAGLPNRISGFYSWDTEGLLIENSLFDHNGWSEGYDYDLSTDSGQPPSLFSHNLYIQYQMDDVTLRDNIIMRGASWGAQVRSGGFLEDNVFIDNNAGFSVLGGAYGENGPIANYSLVTGNVTTSAGYKEVSQWEGALSWGITDSGQLSTLLDNLVVHLADPNNPAELEGKLYDGPAVIESGNAFYDDTVVYGWFGAWRENVQDQNTENVDPTVADETTIQRFIQDFLGDPNAGIPELADVLRAQADGSLDDVVDADLIIRFFQEGFGITPQGIRGEAETLRFVPNELGEGVRWDNRLNWTTEDLPGTQDGDSVDLGGNWVTYSAMTTTLENLELGDDGELRITGGFLEIQGDLTTSGPGGEIGIDRAGQFWLDGYNGVDQLYIDAAGGRLANLGYISGNMDIAVSDNAQAILATGGAAFDQGAGNRLEINGGETEAGFDGSAGGIGLIRLHSEGTLAFTAEDNNIGQIEEFRSGAFGDTPNVQSGLDLGSTTLELDVTALEDASYTLASVDEIMGSFGEIAVTGLGARNAEIVINYENDSVTLNLLEGTGQTTLTTLGDQENDFEASDLWAALTADYGTFDEDNQLQDDADDLLSMA